MFSQWNCRTNHGWLSSQKICHELGLQAATKPDITGVDTSKVDILPVRISSVVGGNTKLRGVPKLVSGSGHAAAVAVLDLLKSWQCDAFVIGMCFDTTASKTSRVGVCTLLETAICRNLLYMACRRHIFEVLLSYTFGYPVDGPWITEYPII